jgi:D-citramalate synthase
MDTTLRDGEQTEEVSFSSQEKLAIAKKLLTEVRIDRVEIASARVSKGEQDTCAQIFGWAKMQVIWIKQKY